ncbi:hypothetical protein ABLN72_07680, partial [Mycobacterium tuberculosis]
LCFVPSMVDCFNLQTSQRPLFFAFIDETLFRVFRATSIRRFHCFRIYRETHRVFVRAASRGARRRCWPGSSAGCAKRTESRNRVSGSAARRLNFPRQDL